MRIATWAVEERLDARRIDYPQTTGSNCTYKAAPRVLKKVTEHMDLFDK